MIHESVVNEGEPSHCKSFFVSIVLLSASPCLQAEIELARVGREFEIEKYEMQNAFNLQV